MRKSQILKLIKVWLPSSFSMAFLNIEIPVITAIVSQGNEGNSLAIFGIALSIIVAVNGAVIPFTPAVISLGNSQKNLKKIKQYAAVLCLMVASLFLLLFFSPFNTYVFRSFLNLEQETIPFLQSALLGFFPAVFFVAWRRYQQGILIKQKNTKPIFYATLLRIVFSVITALVLDSLTSANIAVIGTVSLTVGAFIEALMLFLYLKTISKELVLKEEWDLKTKPINLKSFSRFYGPLTVSTFIPLSYGFIITLGITHAIDRTFALEGWPVLLSLVSLLISPSAEVENVVIPFWKEKENYKPIFQFCALIGGFLSAFLFTILFFPFTFNLYFKKIMGLEEQMVIFIGGNTLFVLFLAPLFFVFKGASRGYLIHIKKTALVQYATFASFLAIIFSILIGNHLGVSGLVIAAFAYSFSIFIELITNLFFVGKNWKERVSH